LDFFSLKNDVEWTYKSTGNVQKKFFKEISFVVGVLGVSDENRGIRIRAH
jgi:hypothetical protein